MKDCNSPDYDTLKILQFVHQNLFMWCLKILNWISVSQSDDLAPSAVMVAVVAYYSVWSVSGIFGTILSLSQFPDTIFQWCGMVSSLDGRF